ncbi:MAG: choline kinase family protein [Anaerolineales bacterium]|nr:choline kinase family protein [Anaerolineales bacterium]
MTLAPQQAIARVPQWEGKEDIRVSPLGGGITNRNFRVDVGTESYVLRIVGAKTDLLGIDRENEYAANLAAGRIGVAPEVIHFIRPEGYLVTRFIDGRPIPHAEIKQPENIRKVAELLNRVHALPPIASKFDAFRIVENYTKIAESYQVAFPENFPWLIEQMYVAESALLVSPYMPRPCHNDMLNENFLLVDGEICLLDWEYAGMGDIFFDLANFSVNHSLDDDQERWFLSCYFGEVTSARWARLKIMKIMSDFREAMWGMVQIGISELDFDFRAYADKHFKRLTTNVSDQRWKEWIKELNK